MQGGLLHEAVAFDAGSGVDDGLGGKTVAWTEVHACRARRIYGKGDEGLKAAREAGRKVYKIKIRSCAAARSLDESHRMRDTRRGLPNGVSGDTLPGSRWNITEVDAITDRAWVYIAIEGPSDAG